MKSSTANKIDKAAIAILLCGSLAFHIWQAIKCSKDETNFLSSNAALTPKTSSNLFFPSTGLSCIAFSNQISSTQKLKLCVK